MIELPAIPTEAVGAAAQELFVAEHGDFTQPDSPWLTTLEGGLRPKYTRHAQRALAAALPHLRPLFEVATQVGLELGRQAAAGEVADACEIASRFHAPRHQSGLLIGAEIAREVMRGTTSARTNPSGHTDLPPTPDAGSKRLPEGTP